MHIKCLFRYEDCIEWVRDSQPVQLCRERSREKLILNVIITQWLSSLLYGMGIRTHQSWYAKFTQVEVTSCVYSPTANPGYDN